MLRKYERTDYFYAVEYGVTVCMVSSAVVLYSKYGVQYSSMARGNWPHPVESFRETPLFIEYSIHMEYEPLSPNADQSRFNLSYGAGYVLTVIYPGDRKRIKPAPTRFVLCGAVLLLLKSQTPPCDSLGAITLTNYGIHA